MIRGDLLLFVGVDWGWARRHYGKLRELTPSILIAGGTKEILFAVGVGFRQTTSNRYLYFLLVF